MTVRIRTIGYLNEGRPQFIDFSDDEAILGNLASFLKIDPEEAIFTDWEGNELDSFSDLTDKSTILYTMKNISGADKMLSRSDLWVRLKNHDWYYEYSDDHRYWTAGRANLAFLREQLKMAECPFSMDNIRKAVLGLCFDKYERIGPDKWRRVQNSTISGRELLERVEIEKIEGWFNEEE